MTVCWLRPPKEEHVSVGREQVAEILDGRGISVEIRDATMETGWDVLAGQDYEAIIGTTRAGALLGSLYKLRHRCPLIIDHIDSIEQFYETAPAWLSPPIHAVESISFRLANNVCFVTERDARRVGRWSRRNFRTTLGVHYDRFAHPSKTVIDAADARLSRYRLNPRVAIYIGGLEPIYRLEALLQAVEDGDQWSLVVIGDGSLADEVRSAPNVSYLGGVPHEQIPGYLALADVGVNLADERTLKVIEYAAAGLPVVHARGTAADRLGELVRHTEPTPEAVRAALDDAWNWPTAHLDEMREWAKTRDWNVVADVYEQAINLVLERSAVDAAPEAAIAQEVVK